MGRGQESPESARPRRNHLRTGRSRLRGRSLPGCSRSYRVTGERRWHAIGAVGLEPGTVAVLLVVHVYREEHNGEEVIRIISARAAEKHEVRIYQKQTID